MKNEKPSDPISYCAPDNAFFENCAFISIDIQGRDDINFKTEHTTDAKLAPVLKQRGFTAEDVNAATDFYYNTTLPNARKVADACRSIELPMIFVHWGHRFEDGMDLSPRARKDFYKEYSLDPKQWPTHISLPHNQPHPALGVTEGDYVIAKTCYDAFPSSNINYVLQNLEIKNIIFVGGNTNGCLKATALSAHQLGFKTLCIADATSDAQQSQHLIALKKTNYTYVMNTNDFLELTSKIKT